MSENVVIQAKSDAFTWQADARHRGDSLLAPEDMYREAARSLGSPGAATAVAILATTGLPPVPLGDDLEASAGPLSTFQAVHEHYRARHSTSSARCPCRGSGSSYSWARGDRSGHPRAAGSSAPADRSPAASGHLLAFSCC